MPIRSVISETQTMTKQLIPQKLLLLIQEASKDDLLLVQWFKTSKANNLTPFYTVVGYILFLSDVNRMNLLGYYVSVVHPISCSSHL